MLASSLQMLAAQIATLMQMQSTVMDFKAEVQALGEAARAHQ